MHGEISLRDENRILGNVTPAKFQDLDTTDRLDLWRDILQEHGLKAAKQKGLNLAECWLATKPT